MLNKNYKFNKFFFKKIMYFKSKVNRRKIIKRNYVN